MPRYLLLSLQYVANVAAYNSSVHFRAPHSGGKPWKIHDSLVIESARAICQSIRERFYRRDLALALLLVLFSPRRNKLSRARAFTNSETGARVLLRKTG